MSMVYIYIYTACIYIYIYIYLIHRKICGFLYKPVGRMHRVQMSYSQDIPTYVHIRNESLLCSPQIYSGKI